MEFLLLFWDDVDDAAAACRHLTVSAVDEVAGISGAVGAAIVACLVSVLRLPS
jgi:hypothetical protein